ncbi:MAG: hypothetical protein ACOYN0_15220 [Phycisphaerales bacterium]
MNVVRGLLLALAVGAVAGGLWFAAVVASGWSLWLLAPLVGFAVGMGMTCFGTQKVDLAGKVLAACAALATIVTVRVFAVSHVVSAELAVTEEDAIEAVAADVAAHMESQGVSDV